MTTSAFRLQQFLHDLGDQKNNNLTLSQAMTKALGVDEKEGLILALGGAIDLYRGVEADIATLDLDDQTKAFLSAELAKVRTVVSLNHMNHKISNLRNDLFEPTRVNGLTGIHASLAGRQDLLEIGPEYDEIVSSFQSAKKAIASSSLGADAKIALVQRLNQISLLLEKYKYFGPSKISDELEGLAGAIAFRTSPEEREENKGVIESIVENAKRLYQIVNVTDKASSSAGRIASKFSEAIEYLNGFNSTPPT